METGDAHRKQVKEDFKTKEGDIDVITAGTYFVLISSTFLIKNQTQQGLEGKKKSEKNNTWIMSTKLDNSQPTNPIIWANEAK